ncbi:MAG: AAA family ATPase [Selenomonadaceae bacterium]|nr:AAA family ATPase [Selenomonadaceae bacterium]MDY2685924.1 AAA family ATPase [Selenomonadaceae bacterium]
MAEIEQKGAIVTFFSTASSVGKTLVSTNLAAELARNGYRVCLLDLDLQFGDVCNYLQLMPESTMADAQQAFAVEGSDAHVEEYLTPYEHDGVVFYVMANPSLLEEAYNIKADAVKRVVQQLQTMFNYVVIDTTSMFSVLNLSMLDISTVVVFLGIVDFIPTIKNMKSGIDTLKKLNYDRNKLRIVLNRSNAKTRIPMDEVKGILGEDFYHILPNDFKAANASIKSGVPLVLSHGSDGLGLALRELVYRSTNQHYEEEYPDHSEEKSGGGLFHRLFGKE